MVEEVNTNTKTLSAKIINDDPKTFTDANFTVGTASHQGDVILVRISKLPNSAKPRQDRQMAIGNTQGSRHVLSEGNPFDCDPLDVINAINIICPSVELQEQYIGPVFQTIQEKASLIHPEHGDHHYEGDMTIACIYQRNLDAEEREKRTRD
jgi:hypothetical protein